MGTLGMGGLAPGFPESAAEGFGLATTDMRANVAAPALEPNDEYSGRVLSSGTLTFFLAEVGREDDKLNSFTAVGAALVTRGTPMSPADSRIFLLTYPRGRSGTDGSFMGGMCWVRVQCVCSA